MKTRRPLAAYSLAALIALGATPLLAPRADAQESTPASIAVAGTTEMIDADGARRPGRAFRGSVRVDGQEAAVEVTLGEGAQAERRLLRFTVPANARLIGVRIEERAPAEGAEDRVEDLLGEDEADAARFTVHPITAEADDDADAAGDDDADAGDDDEDDAADGPVAILSPRDGEVLLVGQSVRVRTRPANARIQIDGPAERDGDEIRLTGAGAVRITAGRRRDRSEAVTVEAVKLSIDSITVEGGLSIQDVRPPHFRAATSDDADPVVEPACIFQNTPLEVRVNVSTPKRLSSNASVTVRARSGETVLSGRLNARGRFARGSFAMESEGALADHVAVNALELQWEVVGSDGDAVSLEQTTPLRVYTTYRAPISNDIWTRTVPVATKLHYELACKWANGASKNIGNGRESIGYQCDNQMRHHVHPKDFKEDTRPFVPAYAPGTPEPLNYHVLPSSWSASSRGERAVSSLYYPPLDVEEPWQDYSNYARNFGWWVLDNPTHTGGRCNQQASLVADILGTLGIRGSVLLLHRVGRGRTTNRPVRQYFASGWNFHGVCNAILEDGTEYCYDGSFSFPPNRKNGTREWAETVPGPFVDGWGTWLYEDRGGAVPEWDIPRRWQGIQ